MEQKHLWWEQEVKEGRHNYQEWRDSGGNLGLWTLVQHVLSGTWQGRIYNAAPAFRCLFCLIMGEENIVAQINVDCTEAETSLGAFLFVIFQG